MLEYILKQGFARRGCETLNRMNAHLEIFSLFTVFSGVLMKSGGFFEGTVGEKMEIRCPYPDEYKYTPMYFCRDPCTSSDHVLIKSEKIDQVVSKGRYSFMNNVNGRSFSVTIRDLRLSDSGVYYCGIDNWFRDKLIKVRLTVKPAPVNRSSHTTKNTPSTSIWTTTHTSAVTNSSNQQNDSGSYEQVSTTIRLENHETPVNVAVVCAAVLVLLLFSVIVALVSLCKKRSDLKSRFSNAPTPENPVQRSPDHNQTADDIYHIYDEMMIGDSSVIYSRVGLSDPAPQVDSLYSLVTHHSG